MGATYPPTTPVYGWPLLVGAQPNDWRDVDDALLAVEATVQEVEAGSGGSGPADGYTRGEADAKFVDAAGDILGGTLRFSSGTVAVKTKAGVPVDADFTAPVDGMIAIDTASHALYFRSGGVWRQATGGGPGPSGGEFGSAPFGTAPFGGA